MPPMNDPDAVSSKRDARLRILINDVAISGAIKADVHSGNSYRGDTFTASLSLTADPKYGIDYWGDDDRKNELIAIEVGILPEGATEGNVPWVRLLLGTVDKPTIDPKMGTVDISGRDLSGLLVDTKIRQTFANLTASQVVQKICAGHTVGANNLPLTADVDETTTRVGAYYKEDHDKLTGDAFNKSTTEWDLLTKLAKEEGFDLYFTGTTLHFKKPVPEDTSNPFVVKWTGRDADHPFPVSNVADLKLERDLHKAKDIYVSVKCWSSKGNKAAEYHAGTKSKNSQVYTRNGGALDPVRAQNLANAWYQEIMRHERRFTCSLPGETVLTARDIIKLEGPLGSWSQIYRVDEITRQIAFDAGFEMHLSCKNHSTNSDANVG